MANSNVLVALVSTSVELDLQNVRPSVRKNLPWFLFCGFILMVNLWIWSHFGLKTVFRPFFGHFWGPFKAKIGDFGEIVPPKFPVVGLFKFSHVRFFWDSRRISGRVFFIFPKIYVWGPYQPSENGSELKICDFLTFPPQIFRSQVCSNLVIQGFLGTPEKYTRMYFSFFWENVSEAHTSPQKMAQNPKNRKNDIFLTFSRWVCGSLLKVQLIFIWVHGNLRGYSRGIYS